MSTASRKGRKAKRVAARQHVTPLPGLFHQPSPLRGTCARCKSRLGPGQQGYLCTFVHGVFKNRQENFQGRVCEVCALELRRHVDKSGPKMHGQAYLTRQAFAPQRYEYEPTPEQMAAYLKRLSTRADSHKLSPDGELTVEQRATLLAWKYTSKKE